MGVSLNLIEKNIRDIYKAREKDANVDFALYPFPSKKLMPVCRYPLSNDQSKKAVEWAPRSRSILQSPV